MSNKKNNNPQGHQLFLKPLEALFLGMAVAGCIEDLRATSTDPKIPWNPETRKQFKEMNEAGASLKVKLEKMGLPVHPLPSYEDGEETNYFTKES